MQDKKPKIYINLFNYGTFFSMHCASGEPSQSNKYKDLEKFFRNSDEAKIVVGKATRHWENQGAEVDINEIHFDYDSSKFTSKTNERVKGLHERINGLQDQLDGKQHENARLKIREQLSKLEKELRAILGRK